MPESAKFRSSPFTTSPSTAVRLSALSSLHLCTADLLCESDPTAANPEGAHGHIFPAHACVDLVLSFFERLESCEHGARFGDHVVFRGSLGTCSL